MINIKFSSFCYVFQVCTHEESPRLSYRRTGWVMLLQALNESLCFVPNQNTICYRRPSNFDAKRQKRKKVVVLCIKTMHYHIDYPAR